MALKDNSIKCLFDLDLSTDCQYFNLSCKQTPEIKSMYTTINPVNKNQIYKND